MRFFEGYPRQISYIVGNEACERFSYYGMRSILVAYMVHTLLMPENESKAVYHLFVSASFFLTLLGGFLADRFLGKYKTIISLSLVYCLGHGVMAFAHDKTVLLIGLGLIALGAGGVKPCVSTHVGDQFNETNKHLLEKIFEIFYWMINVGAFLSSFLIPMVLDRVGPGWAFGIPGILMALSTWIFWKGRHYYVTVPPSGKENSSQFFPILAYSLTHWNPGNGSWLDSAKAKFSSDKVEGAKSAWNVFKIFSFISAFWALYDQQGSTWVLQAEKMDLNVWGFTFSSSQIQAINPILILILVPLFSQVIYPGLRKMGLEMKPLTKMTMGMWVTVLAFGSVTALEIALQTTKLNVAWIFIPSFLISAAEVMISVTGLEFAYTQAPRSMKSTIMSLWFLTISMGNLFTAVFSYLNPFSQANELYFYCGVMAIVAVLFQWVTTGYQEHEYIEASPQPAC